MLEAAEYLLSRGCSPERDVYLAFGEDEETFNTGALAMAKLLESRGVQLEFFAGRGRRQHRVRAVYCAPGVNVCRYTWRRRATRTCSSPQRAREATPATPSAAAPWSTWPRP